MESSFSKYESPKIYQDMLAQALGGSRMDGNDYVVFDNEVADSQTGHMSDRGKLPWHTTFSNESVFATNSKEPVLGLAEGGRWINKNGKWIYEPSAWQLTQPGYLESLQRYYDYEKGRGIDGVQLPSPYKQNLIK